MRICLVASGGGHLRQILQMEQFFRKFDYYIVTEDTPLARSLIGRHPVYFVHHFAFGLRKRRSFAYFVWSGLLNWGKALLVILWKRPQVVISTGSGAAYSTLVFARLFFRRIVYIETFARVKEPSLFGNLAHRLADRVLVQWPGIVEHWPEAIYCNPLRIVEGRIPEKKRQIVVTIGTVMAFDRLIEEMDRLKGEGMIDCPVYAQTGPGRYEPRHIESFRECPYEELNRLMEQSEVVVCHAGTGSILSALKAGCKVVAVARRHELGEHYDNHQFQILEAMEERGFAVGARTTEEIAPAIEKAFAISPQQVQFDTSELVEQIEQILKE